MRVRNQIAIGLAALLAASFVYAKKQKETAEEPPKAAAATTDVVAYMGDVAITREEVNRAAASNLMQVRQREFEVLSGALEGVILQKALEKEAAARGVTTADLMKTEVDDKVPIPAKEEIDTLYEKNKPRYGNRTREEVGPELEANIRQQKLVERRTAFFKELRDKTPVRVMLEPPRVTIAISAQEQAKGPGNAPVTIVEFSDFQCPYCKRAQGTVDQILASYPDKVRLVYRDFPLAFHNRALPASSAARCAGDQGKYWEYHNNLMSSTVQGDLSDADLKKRAEGVGLDATAFNACLESKRHEQAIQASLQEGQNVGVTGTPTFFINGRMFVGAKPLEEFKNVIDDELARASNKTASNTATK